MSTPAPFLSRHLGDYLLVAQLSEDPLGTVFRALYAADERRFVRLRVLQSEELDASSILLTIGEDRRRGSGLSHDAIVVRPELDVVDGIPFMTWDETAGWTLDTFLARVRAFGIRIPAEYALLIVERIAAALEHAHQSGADGGAHGLLWPGFVSISHDAAVRVGGFGIAGAILPSLGGTRMTAEIAPYVAPEVRREGKVSPQADVYSLGAILMELMTGRRPSLDAPSAELRAGDPRSEELGAFLHQCLAEPSGRFASAVEAHRALQQMVTGNPFSLFTANLALFLYKLLNPESQSVAPTSDWESTSPVVVETKTRRGDSTGTRKSAPVAAAPGPLRRRRGDLDGVEEAAIPPEVAAVVAIAAPAASPDPFPDPAAPPADADLAPAPLPLQRHAADLIEGIPPVPPAEFPPLPWRRSAAILVAAAGLAAGAFLIAGRTGSPVPSLPPMPPAESVVAAPSVPAPAIAAPAAPLPPPTGAVPVARAVAPARSSKKIHTEAKQPAEDLRYRAAIARIEADRVSAREKAPDVFDQGERSEKEGLRLLRERDYDAAQLAFSRAAELFQQAQERSWEERVRGASLSTRVP